MCWWLRGLLLPEEMKHGSCHHSWQLPWGPVPRPWAALQRWDSRDMLTEWNTDAQSCHLLQDTQLTLGTWLQSLQPPLTTLQQMQHLP